MKHLRIFEDFESGVNIIEDIFENLCDKYNSLSFTINDYMDWEEEELGDDLLKNDVLVILTYDRSSDKEVEFKDIPELKMFTSPSIYWTSRTHRPLSIKDKKEFTDSLQLTPIFKRIFNLTEYKIFSVERDIDQVWILFSLRETNHLVESQSNQINEIEEIEDFFNHLEQEYDVSVSDNKVSQYYNHLRNYNMLPNNKFCVVIINKNSKKIMDMIRDIKGVISRLQSLTDYAPTSVLTFTGHKSDEKMGRFRDFNMIIQYRDIEDRSKFKFSLLDSGNEYINPSSLDLMVVEKVSMFIGKK